MVDIETIKAELKKCLSEKRYNHSLGVANEAAKLARRYSVDENKAYLAGLVHDVAKEIPPDKTIEKLSAYGVYVDKYSKMTPKVLHGALGAIEAQKRFEIYDIDVLDAIKYHTTGKSGMTMLGKIIYIADYIEPGRKFEGVSELRHLAYDNIDEAIIKGVGDIINDLISRGLIIHPDTVLCRNDLISQRIQEENTD